MDTKKLASRPISITIICILGFLGILPSVFLVFSEAAKSIGSWYPPYLGLSIVFGLISFTGMWLMKKWGAYLYSGFFLLNQILMIYMGVWNIFALVLPGVVVGVALYNLKKMSD
ncbi:hypothetical protein GW755_03990 [bacterium]|nr:hypothetical protein [bacterium]